ncbi:hypothetical protein GCM10020256_53920 [Streptomyces thermocoprophilus]
MLVPVAHDTSGQSDSTEQASKPRVMESPTATIDSGCGFHDGVGLADGRVPSGTPDEPCAPPAASQPAAPQHRRHDDGQPGPHPAAGVPHPLTP